MSWVYVLEDLAGVALSELPGARQKRVVPSPVGTLATAGFTVPLDHDDADFLLEGDALLKVYEDHVPGATEPVLRFHGRLITAEEVAGVDGKYSVATTWSDPFWVLLRRLCGKSPVGYKLGGPTDLRDRGGIIADLVNATNAENASGLRMGPVTPSSRTYIEGWYYQRVGEKIAELAATLDGPDWQVLPIEYAKSVDLVTVAADTFEGMPSSSRLNGRVSTSGHLWESFGGLANNDDFTWFGGNTPPPVSAVARANPAGYPPLYALLGAADYATVDIQAKTYMDGAGTEIFWLIARWVDVNNFVALRWQSGVRWQIVKVINGAAPVEIAGAALGAVSGPFTMRLEIDAAGSARGTGVGAALTVTDPDLAAGGKLARGRLGIAHTATSATAAVFDDVLFKGIPDGGYYGELAVAPVIGTTRPDAVFEYGDGLLNVSEYRRGVSLEGSINRGYHLPPGFPDNAVQSVLTQQDAPSQAARGLLEDVVAGDLSVDELRTRLLAHHISVRKGPRQTITFTPVVDRAGRVPRYGVDYVTGDVVPFRASVRKGRTLNKRIDALVRIYQTEVTVDDLGNPTYNLTVTPT